MLYFFKRTREKYNWFWKEENFNVNKRRTKIPSRCKSMLHLRKKIFHNSSNYDYHFVIKELSNEFEGKFECLRENTWTYKNFSIPIEKEVANIDKVGNERVANISYKI